MSLPNFQIFSVWMLLGFKTYLTPWRVQARLSSCLLAVKLTFNFNAEVCQAGLFLSLAINPINIQKTCDPLSAKCISWTRFTSINPLSEAGLTPPKPPISRLATQARTTPLCLVQRDRLSIDDSYGLFLGIVISLMSSILILMIKLTLGAKLPCYLAIL